MLLLIDAPLEAELSDVLLEERQRRSIIQPRVARNELPWVIRHPFAPTLKGLNREGDATA